VVVDVCGTSLADATTYTEDAFESKAFATAAAPALDQSLTPPLTKRFGFAKQKDPEQVRREAQRAEAFEAKMEADRQLLEARHLAKDAVERKLLMELLEQPVAEKAKGASGLSAGRFEGYKLGYTGGVNTDADKDAIGEAATQQEVVDAKSRCKKKLAIARALNIPTAPTGHIYKTGAFKRTHITYPLQI
jgi:hypothetical protein